MKITILTLFPAMIEGFFKESIVKRAQEKSLLEINLVNFRDFAMDDYGSVDDRPYGGGAGMIMRVDVIYKALENVKTQMSNVKTKFKNSNLKTVLTSPKGKVFDQNTAAEYANLDQLIIIAGHYEDVDERVKEYVDEEVSLGDFIMTGGEITAAAITDSVARLLPGVLKKEEATKFESFFEIPIIRMIGVIGKNPILQNLLKRGQKKVKLLEYPQYTRPEEYLGKKVPAVLLSGNHREIEKWKLQKAFEETLKKRPDLLGKS